MQGQIYDSGGQQYCRDNVILNNSHVLNTKLQVRIYMFHKILIFNLFTAACWDYTKEMDVRRLKSTLSMSLHVCVPEPEPWICQTVILLLVYMCIVFFPRGDNFCVKGTENAHQ